MESFLEWISKQPLPITIAILCLVTIILVIVNVEKFKGFFPILNKKQRRRCCDCIVLHSHLKDDYSKKRSIIESHIIPDQNQFAKQKVREVEFKLLQSYREDLTNLREKEDTIKENIEFITYRECLKNAIYLVNSEIDRAFLENGFHELDDLKFQVYVKNMTTNLINIAQEYLLAAYPTSGMTITINYRFNKLNISEINSVVNDIFAKAKDLRIQANKQLELLEEEYKKKSDDFLKSIN